MDPDTNDEIPDLEGLPSEDLNTASALDKMLDDVSDDAAPDAAPEGTLDDKLAAAPDVAPDAAPEAKPDVAPEVIAEKDELDAVELPPHTKPKTGEAFDTVKRIAREKIVELSKKAAELETAKGELEAKVKSIGDGMTPEIKKELDELRAFRRGLDVEADPEFKAFDAKAQANTETIYTKLLAAGATSETIDKIKALGGPNGVDWEPILAKLNPVTRRVIESKLVENEDLGEKKTLAIEAAKKNSDQFLKTRAAQTEEQKKSLQTRAEDTLKDLLPSFEWLKPKTADAKATPEQKAAVTKHNELVKESQQYMKEAIADDSPEMRATLALAGPELFRARAELSALKSSSEAQIIKLTGELKASNDLLAKVKNGSTGRLRNTSAEGKPGKTIHNETAEEALDRYLSEATESGS